MNACLCPCSHLCHRELNKQAQTGQLAKDLPSGHLSRVSHGIYLPFPVPGIKEEGREGSFEQIRIHGAELTRLTAQCVVSTTWTPAHAVNSQLHRCGAWQEKAF